MNRSHLFTGFFQSLLMYAAFAVGLYFTVVQLVPAGGERLFGFDTRQWTLILGAVVVLHQLIVWFGFRFQLLFKLFSRLFGKRDLLVWGFFFFPLLAARAVLSGIIAYLDWGSLPGPEALYAGLGIVLAVPAVYAMYTVIRYFGLVRAMGGNYFRESYRSLPMETRGMYRFSSNVMYTFVFLGFWSHALVTRSSAALITALFQHALIWVHYYTVEEPDLRVMYK